MKNSTREETCTVNVMGVMGDTHPPFSCAIFDSPRHVQANPLDRCEDHLEKRNHSCNEIGVHSCLEVIS